MQIDNVAGIVKRQIGAGPGFNIDDRETLHSHMGRVEVERAAIFDVELRIRPAIKNSAVGRSRQPGRIQFHIIIRESVVQRRFRRRIATRDIALIRHHPAEIDMVVATYRTINHQPGRVVGDEGSRGVEKLIDAAHSDLIEERQVVNVEAEVHGVEPGVAKPHRANLSGLNQRRGAGVADCIDRRTRAGVDRVPSPVAHQHGVGAGPEGRLLAARSARKMRGGK